MVRATQDGAVVIVVMGVSGVGKTTVAVGLAAALGWVFAEGDDFHPAANVAAMRAGTPLTDEDRRPWLAAVASWIDGRNTAADNAVVTCSALKRSYRDLLRAGRSDVIFVELDAPATALQDRVAGRIGHYMPAGLLPSQLALLEPLQPDERGVRIPAVGPPDRVVADTLSALELRFGPLGS